MFFLLSIVGTPWLFAMPSELSGLVGGRARQSERRGLAVAAAALAVIALAGIALAVNSRGAAASSVPFPSLAARPRRVRLLCVPGRGVSEAADACVPRRAV